MIRRYIIWRNRNADDKALRAAIAWAARDLFLEHGYGNTTLSDVARAAGVSVETIHKSEGTKAILLHKAWDITVGGDDQDIVFHERSEVLAIRSEPDLARRLMLHAALSTQTAQRIAPFQLMVQSAAGSDPAAAAMLEEMDRQRLAGIGVMAAEAAKTGQLAVPRDECRDVIWSMTDGMLWHRLVDERGWTNDRFAQWLGGVWVDRLVKKGHRPTRSATCATVHTATNRRCACRRIAEFGRGRLTCRCRATRAWPTFPATRWAGAGGTDDVADRTRSGSRGCAGNLGAHVWESVGLPVDPGL